MLKEGNITAFPGREVSSADPQRSHVTVKSRGLAVGVFGFAPSAQDAVAAPPPLSGALTSLHHRVPQFSAAAALTRRCVLTLVHL